MIIMLICWIIFTGSKYVQKLEFGIASMHMKGPYSEESGVITCRARNRAGVDETQAEFVCKGDYQCKENNICTC